MILRDITPLNRGLFSIVRPIASALGANLQRGLGLVSRNSRKFTGHFRVSQFPLYLKNGEDLSRQTSELFFFVTLKTR